MMRFLKICSKVLLVLCLSICLGMEDARSGGKPGEFDYYVLSLSWSPEYCATSTKPDPTQCGQRRYSLVVHGLWPQYNNGSFPESCIRPTQKVPRAIVDRMLDLMPNRQLIQHEWDKHGTCSGLSVQKYFELTRQLYQTIAIPPKYQQPSDYISTSVKTLEDDLISLNPKLDGSKIAVDCKGRYLQEIRVCYDNQLQPLPCGRNVTDKCKSSVVLRPVR